jgi:hypothetical protein
MTILPMPLGRALENSACSESRLAFSRREASHWGSIGYPHDPRTI